MDLIDKLKNKTVITILILLTTVIIKIGWVINICKDWCMQLGYLSEEVIIEIVEIPDRISDNPDSAYYLLDYANNFMIKNDTIRSNFHFVDDFKKKNLIEAERIHLKYKPIYQEFLPHLNIKILNNTTESISINKFVIDLISSKRYDIPLISMRTFANKPFSLELIDKNGAKWTKIELKFNFHTRPSAPSLTNFILNNWEYNHSCEISYFNDTIINLTEYLQRDSIDTEILAQLKPELCKPMKRLSHNLVRPWVTPNDYGNFDYGIFWTVMEGTMGSLNN